jgi:hypothetical protein
MALAAGVGFWVLWQFIRARRAADRDRPDEAGSHHLGVFGIGRQTWLLIPVASIAYIDHALDSWEPGRANPGFIVLAAGVGLWALWQFFRAGHAANTKTTPPEIHRPKPGPTRDFDGF